MTVFGASNTLGKAHFPNNRYFNTCTGTSGLIAETSRRNFPPTPTRHWHSSPYVIFPYLASDVTIIWKVHPSGTARACTTREAGAL